jgi:hypothetical protein
MSIHLATLTNSWRILETSPTEGVCAGDMDVIANDEPIQEMERIDKGIHHGNVVALITATSNEASMEPGECRMVQMLLDHHVVCRYGMTPPSSSIRNNLLISWMASDVHLVICFVSTR